MEEGAWFKVWLLIIRSFAPSTLFGLVEVVHTLYVCMGHWYFKLMFHSSNLKETTEELLATTNLITKTAFSANAQPAQVRLAQRDCSSKVWLKSSGARITHVHQWISGMRCTIERRSEVYLPIKKCTIIKIYRRESQSPMTATGPSMSNYKSWIHKETALKNLCNSKGK